MHAVCLPKLSTPSTDIVAHVDDDDGVDDDDDDNGDDVYIGCTSVAVSGRSNKHDGGSESTVYSGVPVISRRSTVCS